MSEAQLKLFFIAKMICCDRHMNTSITSMTCILLFILIIPLCYSIRLEYRPSLGQVFTYFDGEVVETIDFDDDSDNSIKRQEMIYTERIIDIDESNDGITTVEIDTRSVELTPQNETRKNLLLGIRHVKVNRQCMIQDPFTYVTVGDINNVFPLHDIEVGQSWTTTANGLTTGNNTFTLIDVDQEQVATVEIETSYSVLRGLGNARGFQIWKVDIETGILLEKKQMNTIQALSMEVNTITHKKLIARE